MKAHHRRLPLLCAFVIVLALISACTKGSTVSAGNYHVELTVSPDHPTMNKPIAFEVRVTATDGQPVSDADVTGALTMKLMDMGATQLKFAPKGNGNYEATVKSLDMSGPWSLAVNAKRGRESTQRSFDVNVFD